MSHNDFLRSFWTRLKLPSFFYLICLYIVVSWYRFVLLNSNKLQIHSLISNKRHFIKVSEYLIVADLIAHVTASNHTNWLACGLNDLSHVHSAKMQRCEGLVELCKVLFSHEDQIYPRIWEHFSRGQTGLGKKKVMWGKQVWGVSSVNKDTPHVHTILWLVSSVSSLILLRKCLLNATSASKWAPFISPFIKLQSVFILLLIYLGLFWLNQIYLNEGLIV